jgi:kynurenine formamidase
MTDSPDSRARLIDLSHTVEDGMITYKGLPAPIVCDYLSREASRGRYAEGTEFQIGKIELVANTGTYVDSPFHRYADGKDLSELALESLANLDCVVIRATERADRAIDDIPPALDVRGKAVLFHTGWDAHWRTDQYFEGHPYLTGGLASAYSRPALRWWESTPSTSTARMTASGPCIRRCSAQRSRSSSICAGSRRFRTRVRASMPYP